MFSKTYKLKQVTSVSKTDVRQSANFISKTAFINVKFGEKYMY